MAHTCPECGMRCYCHGDIDDIDSGDDCSAARLCDCCWDDDEEPSYYDDGEYDDYSE